MDNLLVNGNFETGSTEPWIKLNGAGTGLLKSSDNYKMFGTYVLAGGGGGGTTAVNTSWYQEFNVTTQNNFYLSGWFKNTSGDDDYARGSVIFFDSGGATLQRDYIHNEHPDGPYTHFREYYGSVPAGATKCWVIFDTIRRGGSVANCAFDGAVFVFDQNGEEIKWKDEIISRVTFQEEENGNFPPYCHAKNPLRWTSSVGLDEGPNIAGPYPSAPVNNSRSLWGHNWIKTADGPRIYGEERPKGGTISFWANLDVVAPLTLDAAAADNAPEGVKIYITGHPYESANPVTKNVRLTGTQNYDGDYELVLGEEGANYIVITAPFVSETFTGSETISLTASQDVLFAGDHESSFDRLTLSVEKDGNIKLYCKIGGVLFDDIWINDGSVVAGQWAFFEVTLFNLSAFVKVNGTQIIFRAIPQTSDYTNALSGAITFGAERGNEASFSIADIAITNIEPLVYGKTVLPTDIMPLPPGPTITQHPQDVYGSPGGVRIFSVSVFDNGEEASFQWYKNDEPITGETSSTLEITLSEVLSPSEYWVKVSDQYGYQDSRRAQAIVYSGAEEPETVYREGMLWNFEDNNFSWMDSSIDKINQLEDIVCMKYQPDPGFITRWADLKVGGSYERTWQELESNNALWSDFYGKGAELNMYWLSDTGLWLSDQFVKINGKKQYYVERVLIDLNEIVSDFTSNRWIYANQLYFHLKGLLESEESNYFNVSVGWADTLNDEPDFLPLERVNLQTRQRQGTVKHDFRSTGRYLALRFEFNETSKIQFTGAEINAEQTHGR